MQSSKFASYFGGISHALSARDYRIYWYAHVFSSHGVWMHRMAVGVLIFQLTDSPAWLGFIRFVYSLPLMLLGPIAGAIADRFGIRRTAIIAIIVTIALTCLNQVVRKPASVTKSGRHLGGKISRRRSRNRFLTPRLSYADKG